MKIDQVHFLSNEDNILKIGIGGRVDINNANVTEDNITEIIKENKFDQLILDLSDLEYISSVGIRILMKLFKAYKGMEIENASSEVYDILNMTGLTTVIPISKKLREIFVENLEKIWVGFNGAVYRIDDETIIKVIN